MMSPHANGTMFVKWITRSLCTHVRVHVFWGPSFFLFLLLFLIYLNFFFTSQKEKKKKRCRNWLKEIGAQLLCTTVKFLFIILLRLFVFFVVGLATLFLFFPNPGINKVIRNECGTAQQSDTSRKHSGKRRTHTAHPEWRTTKRRQSSSRQLRDKRVVSPGRPASSSSSFPSPFPFCSALL